MIDEDRDMRTPIEPLWQRLVAGVLRAVMRATLSRTLSADLPVATQRRRLLMATRLTLAPRGIDFSAGRCGGVPGEWVTGRGTQQSRGAVLYLHGGGYATGAPATHRAVTGHLAARCQARVFAADYRLAPECPFPAGLDDALAAYRGMLAEGLQPSEIVIGGDSAGGGLTLAVALQLRSLGEAMPRALVLFSPWVDLTGEQADTQAAEIMLTPALLSKCASAYAAGRDLRDPLLSPLFADLRGLPPTLVQVGTDELLLPDSRRLRERLEIHGVPVRYEEYPRRWHVFQVNAGLLADADRALGSVARFIRDAGVGYGTGNRSTPPSAG